jgi:hypothetical protein
LINRRLKRSISRSVQIVSIKQRLSLPAEPAAMSWVVDWCIFLLTTDIRATSRRKIEVFGIVVNSAGQRKTRRS